MLKHESEKMEIRRQQQKKDFFQLQGSEGRSQREREEKRKKENIFFLSKIKFWHISIIAVFLVKRRER